MFMPSVDLLPRLRRRRQARVLVLSRDRRYLTEASQRLRATGLEVATTCRASEIVELIQARQLNVAVVDSTHYLSGIVRTMSAMDRLGTPLAVLTVAEDSLISPLSGGRVLPKWAALDRLHEHVELAFELHPSHDSPAAVAVA